MIVTKADDSFKSSSTVAPWYQSQRWQINFELLKAEYRLSLRTFVYIRVSCLFTMLHYMSYEINLLVVNNQMTLILADFQWLCQSMSNQYSNSNNERKYWFYLSNKLQRDDTICKLESISALCYRNFQNVKLSHHNVEILQFPWDSDYTWN